MNEQELQDLLEGFQEVNYPKVKRNQQAYDQTDEFIEAEVARLLEMYRGLTTLDQRARLIRDGLDLYLRRGHGYSIEGNIGAHYRQIGVRVEDCDFEHMIPQAKIRDALIQGRLTIRQAMNPPTCWLHRDLHQQLKQAGWASRTPSLWYFFRRYGVVFQAEYETFNGTRIHNPDEWSFADHCRFFNI